VRGKRRVLEILQRNLAEIDEKIDSLQRLRIDLQTNIARMEAFIARSRHD
jgi:hypothetical protein